MSREKTQHREQRHKDFEVWSALFAPTGVGKRFDVGCEGFIELCELARFDHNQLKKVFSVSLFFVLGFRKRKNLSLRTQFDSLSRPHAPRHSRSVMRDAVSSLRIQEDDATMSIEPRLE